MVAETRAHKSRKTLVCVYDFHTAEGTLAFQKLRYAVESADGGREKCFAYRHKARDLAELSRGRSTGTGLWLWGKPLAADRLLYQLPEVRGALASGQDVWWTEGEKDADALAALGVTATSHHGGAGHVTADQAAWFSWMSYRSRVWLVADRDSPGAADAVLRYDLLRAAGVPAERLQILRAREGKDAADHLAAGHGIAGFLSVPLDVLREVAAFTTSSDYGRAGYQASAGKS